MHPSSVAIRLHVMSSWMWRRKAHGAARAVAAISRTLTAIEIDPDAQIAQGCIIAHGAGCVIGGGSVLGEGCVLHQGVTIGRRTVSDLRMPVLGSRVYVGANACILGGVTVGDGATIGAGSVVLQDVPAGWTAVGNPARLLPPKEQRSALKGREPLLQARDGR